MANTWTIFSRWLGALRWGAVLRFSPLLWCVLFTAPALSAPFTKTFAGTVQSVAHAVARHEIYVSAGNAIAVLDDSSFNVLRSFDVPDGSGSLRLTSDEKQLFFFHGFTQQFAVIDLDSGVRRERPRTADVPNPASAVELGAGRFVGSDFFNTTTLFTMDGNDQISVTAKLRGRLLATDVAHGFLYIAAAEEVQKIDMNDPALPLIARHRANANRALLSPDGQRLFTD